MDIEKKLLEINGSFYLPVSREHLQHIGIDIEKALNTEKERYVIIRDDQGKYGPFVSFWRKPDGH